MFLAFLIAAAQPDPTGLTALAEADTRLVTIGRRLSKGGAGLCGGAVANPGWTIEDAEQFAPPLRAQVRTALKLGDYPTVVAVEPGSGAARGGLRVGDELLAVGSAAVPPTRHRVRRERGRKRSRRISPPLWPQGRLRCACNETEKRSICR